MRQLQKSLIKRRSRDKKIKSVLTIFLKNNYDKIIANVNNTKVRNQEEKNKIFTMY